MPPANRKSPSFTGPSSKPFVEFLDECFELARADAKRFPDILEPYDRPHAHEFYPDGRRKPIYCLGWLLPQFDLVSYVDPYPGQERTKWFPAPEIQRKWRALGAEKKFPAPALFNVQDYALFALVYNEPKDLAHLCNANSEWDPSLVREVVRVGAASMGLPEEMVDRVKWWNLSSLAIERATLTSKLLQYADEAWEAMSGSEGDGELESGSNASD
ncbi:hypothetical protein OE88DRAFT_1733983 [Heliocybe sulcata]|uniref:Uncharacterized protein n=1 Tax=Heliocybe sulcata TaxID=5364 RepID=A0A5C3N888_9AGAM|nr:hypothetical protein OE88DRAFT_1733983 [Heliocybe sulcata]